jgi:hypothetical protein
VIDRLRQTHTRYVERQRSDEASLDPPAKQERRRNASLLTANTRVEFLLTGVPRNT